MVTGGAEGRRDGSWHEMVAGCQCRMQKRCWKWAVMITLSNSENALHASELTLKRANMVNLLQFYHNKTFFNAENKNFTEPH